ncbi:cell wall hydrolase [Hungatella sp.]|uniref:cell wall hydrolase n=1 Tax=Hungatella sp. TaxID=2613924 RepID=UPI002583F2FB|nr:cell wall hydrolase [Hungatella sp.]MCI6453154.1 cell wall hydrolase [Hungatella sp.]
MRKLIKVIAVPILCGIVIASSFFVSEFHPEEKDVAAISRTNVVKKIEPVITVLQEESIPIATEEMGGSEEAIPKMSREDVELIALVTMAEAEGECEEGKRLVIDTILNRIDTEHFPDTVYEVIYQPNQFSSMWNGRVDRCEVREDICELVYEELESRTNYDVVFFTAGEYSAYGVPMFQVGNHYFSKYE